MTQYLKIEIDRVFYIKLKDVQLHVLVILVKMIITPL